MAPALSWLDRNATVFKVLLCGFLLLILMIPTSMIRSTIDERASRAVDARNEIMSKWGGNQTLSGPIISVPYVYEKQIRYYHLLPQTLDITTNLVPEVRKRGIYSTIIYTSDNTIRATFSPLASMVPTSFIARDRLQWNRAVISYGISDMKGIEKNIEATLGGKPLAFQPGLITTDVITAGVSREIALSGTDAPVLQLLVGLRGGEQIQYLPVGKESSVTVSGAWSSPSFNGAFLPNERNVENGAFSANWRVTDFNRNFPQHWDSNTYQLQYIPQSQSYRPRDFYDGDKMSLSEAVNVGGTNNMGESVFGVKLIEVVDHYDKVTRSIKYAFLIIGLSFLSFFLMEVVRKKPIHVLQYLLIGFALVVFYTLLLSLSEHISFNPAYILSSIATISLVSLYTKSVCRSWEYASITGGILVVLYTLVFVILQSEDYALLIGSIAVFVILGVLMYATRNIDWYNSKK